jgi:hypothetical protein
MRFIVAIIIAACALSADSAPRLSHPRVYFTNADVPALREKAKNVDWAKKIVADWHKAVDRHVERHAKDPEFILSHLQMHWEKGKHYTHHYTDGNYIPRREGNAKYPTIRTPYARSWGNGIKSGDWENDPPYSDGTLRAKDGTPIPFDRTGQAYENLNDWFLSLAYKAAILYHLEGDEKYAKFAADITWILVRGGSQQEWVNPDQKGGNNGFLSWETLGDTRHYWAIPLIWDMLYDYYNGKYFEELRVRSGELGVSRGDRLMIKASVAEGKEANLERFHVFFEKMIDNKLERGGGLIGNWNMNEQQSAMLYALALDDDAAYVDGKGRKYYVRKIVKGPTTASHGAYMDVLRANIDPESGLWPEAPGGYGQGSTAQIVKFGFIYWKSGLNLLSRDPLLKKAATAIFQMVHPNGYIANVGDSSYHRIWTDSLELLCSYAKSTGDEEMLSQCAGAIKQTGGRSLRDDIAFFFYLPELPDVAVPKLSRVSYAPCFPCIVERNFAKSGDPVDALSFSLAGFSKKMGHRHANGLTLELCGRGEILAPDIGAGGDYWCRETHQYYRHVAAHNTVVVNGLGLDDNRVEMLLDIKAAEPQIVAGADVSKSKSPHRQFVDVESIYDAKEVKARQRRTVAIVRSGAKTGYFIDIFRSKEAEGDVKYQDYIYHNVGEWESSFAVAAEDKTENGELDPKSGKGYEYFKTIASWKGGTSVRPLAVDYDGDLKTGIHLATQKEDAIYQLEGPKAFRHYNREVGEKPCPTLLVRRKGGNAWNAPFIAVYEPYGRGVSEQIAHVEREPVQGDEEGVKVTVFYKDASRRDEIVHSPNVGFSVKAFKDAECVNTYKAPVE